MKDVSGAGIGDLTIKKCLDLFFKFDVVMYPTKHIRTKGGLCPLQVATNEFGNSYVLTAQGMGLPYKHARRLIIAADTTRRRILAADLRPFMANNKTSNLRLVIEKRMGTQYV